MYLLIAHLFLSELLSLIRETQRRATKRKAADCDKTAKVVMKSLRAKRVYPKPKTVFFQPLFLALACKRFQQILVVKNFKNPDRCKYMKSTEKVGFGVEFGFGWFGFGWLLGFSLSITSTCPLATSGDSSCQDSMLLHYCSTQCLSDFFHDCSKVSLPI